MSVDMVQAQAAQNEHQEAQHRLQQQTCALQLELEARDSRIAKLQVCVIHVYEQHTHTHTFM